MLSALLITADEVLESGSSVHAYAAHARSGPSTKSALCGWPDLMPGTDPDRGPQKLSAKSVRVGRRAVLPRSIFRGDKLTA